MIVNAGKAEYLRPARFDYDVGERCSSRHYPEYDVSKPTEAHRRIQRLIALWQMTYVGPPMVYYGTEAGMWGGDDPDDRMPMFWDDLGEYATRSSHPLGNPRTPDSVSVDKDLHGYYRKLIRLRRKSVALRRGEFRVLGADDDQSTLVFQRHHEHDTLLVVLNRSTESATMDVAVDKLGVAWAKISTEMTTPNTSATATVTDNGLRIKISGTAGGVFRVSQ